MEVKQATNMKFYLNNKEIKVLNGATFSIKKDETLDSGKVELIFTEDKSPIKPMSELRIEDNNDTYNFVVLSDTVEIASKEPKAYKHTLNFAQNTKKLSKIQVRNTQFSQPAKNSLKCGCNATFLNKADEGSSYMNNLVRFGDKKEYSYSMEISKKHKVKSAYFQVNTYWSKYESEMAAIYEETMQDTCPALTISFDVYNGNKWVLSKEGTYTNGSVEYLLKGLDDGIYTIKNLKVVKSNSYNEHDLFIVNVSLVCDVYYYSLYDVLDVLRKQIALQEGLIGIINDPVIYFSEKTTNHFIYEIKNNNQFDCNLYVRTWDKYGTKPVNYTNMGVVPANTMFKTENTFTQTRLYVEAYFVNSEDASMLSNEVSEYKSCPPFNYEYELYLSEFGKDADDKYELELEGQFQTENDFDNPQSIWRYIEDKELYKLENYTYNADKSTLTKQEIAKIYGYEILELKKPNISISQEYISSSGGYQVKVNFTNTNEKKCKIYWYAEGSLPVDANYLDNGKEFEYGEVGSYILGTYNTSSSGKIYARCEYKDLAGDYNSQTWVSSGIATPFITFTKISDSKYSCTIKQLNDPYETLYYRIKLGNEYSTWGAWQSEDYVQSYTFTQSNETIRDLTLYVEAYSVVSGKQSDTVSAQQLISKGIEKIEEPTIIYSAINDYKGTFSVRTNATQSDAITYYKYTKNGTTIVDYKEYTEPFTLEATQGEDDTYIVSAYTNSKIGGGDSDYTNMTQTLYGTKNLTRPEITITSEYNASSSGYSMYVKFTNNNNIAVDINWSSSGTFVKYNQIISSIPANSTTDKYLIGVSTTSSDKGTVAAYCYIDDTYRSGSNTADWTWAGPVYCTLTLKYVGAGLSETVTKTFNSGTVINPSDYVETYSGYVYQNCSPSDSFKILQDTTITYTYIVGGELDSPVFSEYSQTQSNLVMKVTSTNPDTVSLYYVINPNEVPTSFEDIESATDHYVISSISSSTTEAIPWGSDASLTIYGAFISTSHSTTYSNSGVSSKTFYKRVTLVAPVIELQSYTSTSFTVKVTNKNLVTVAATDNEGALTSISRNSSTTFTYSWGGSTQSVTITFSASGYYSSSSTETFTRPIELSTPRIEYVNSSDKIVFTVYNDSSHDATFSYNSTVIAGGQYMNITHIWQDSETSYTMSGYFYNGYDIRSDTASTTVAKPSKTTIQLKKPVITYAQGTGAFSSKYKVTITNSDNISVACYISGEVSDTQSLSANGSYTFYIDYLSTTARTINAMTYKTSTSDTEYLNSDTTTITIPATSN